MDKIPYIAPNDFDREYFFEKDKKYFAKKLQEKLVIPGTMWKEMLEYKGRYSTSSSMSFPPTSNQGKIYQDYRSNAHIPQEPPAIPASNSDIRKDGLKGIAKYIYFLMLTIIKHSDHTRLLHTSVSDIIGTPFYTDDNNMFLQELHDITNNNDVIMDEMHNLIFIVENFIIYVEKMIKGDKIEMKAPMINYRGGDGNLEYYFDKVKITLKILKDKKREIRNGIRI